MWHVINKELKNLWNMIRKLNYTVEQK
jgi:hypothetical protein